MGAGKFRMSPGSLKQGKIVPAAYYPCEISVEHKISKNKDSMNHWFKFKVTHGPEAGISFSWLCNEKAIDDSAGIDSVKKQFRELLEAVEIPINEEEGVEGNWDLFQGLKCDVYSKPGRDMNDVSINEVAGFKKFTVAA
jgi:hypothetical protein